MASGGYLGWIKDFASAGCAVSRESVVSGKVDAPGERVEIASVARCWALLKAVLRTLAEG